MWDRRWKTLGVRGRRLLRRENELEVGAVFCKANGGKETAPGLTLHQNLPGPLGFRHADGMTQQPPTQAMVAVARSDRQIEHTITQRIHRLDDIDTDDLSVELGDSHLGALWMSGFHAIDVMQQIPGNLVRVRAENPRVSWPEAAHSLTMLRCLVRL